MKEAWKEFSKESMKEDQEKSLKESRQNFRKKKQVVLEKNENSKGIFKRATGEISVKP